MSRWKDAGRVAPGLVPLIRRLRRMLAGGPSSAFAGSAAYWRQRYAAGGDSGVGSYGKFAAFKARVLNDFFADQGIRSVIEFGCGDGNQLRQLVVDDYVGIDVSPEAVSRCRTLFAGQPGRRFVLAGEEAGLRADCAMSLDVIFHLVEDEVFESYMADLFAAAGRHVVVYSSNRDDEERIEGQHVRHRRFTVWIERNRPEWTLCRHVPNLYPFNGDYRSGSYADFFFFERREDTGR